LIVLTHGDFDHIGNAAYLSKKFGAKIASEVSGWNLTGEVRQFAAKFCRAKATQDSEV